eukprot:gene3621-14855_t
MKPNEDKNPESLDYEVSPLEVFQDVGVLIVEGRLPEFSFSGRREGTHCWPVSPFSEKNCCHVGSENKRSMQKHKARSIKIRDINTDPELSVGLTYMCNFVKSTRKRMEDIWKGTIPLFIEVLVCLDNLFPHTGKEKDPSEIYLDFLPDSRTQGTLLLERWKLKLNDKRIVKEEDVHPLDFISPPEAHTFPQALISRTEVVETIVHSLPRLNLETLISMSPYREFNLLIERQIWMCSHEKAVQKSEFGMEISNNSTDSEETPYKKKLTKGSENGCQNGTHCDVIFVPDPVVRPRIKLQRERTGKIGAALRKRLSFECDQQTTQELPGSQKFERWQKKNGPKCRRMFSFEGGDDRKKKTLESRAISCQQGKKCEGNSGNSDHDFDVVMSLEDEWNAKSSKTALNEDNSVSKGNIHKDLVASDRSNDCQLVSSRNPTVEDCSRHKIFHIGTEDGDDNVFKDNNNCKIDNMVGTSENGLGRFSNESRCQSRGKSSANGGKVVTNSCNDGVKCDDRESEKQFDLNLNVDKNTADSAITKLESQVNSLSFAEQIQQNGNDKGGKSSRIQVENEMESSLPDGKLHLGRCFSSANFSKNTKEKMRRSESYTGARPIPFATRLSLGACTVPVFHAKTGLPVASSPAPLRRPEKAKNGDENGNENGTLLSPSVEIKKSRKSSCEYGGLQSSKLLSRSAPASTRLLGNFEESVLKGRIPVFGTVEGFTAEIGASGLFCPKHITLPIKCQFFRTSDDNAPSPYMGHISLRNSKGKKGYHVPRKGTIQLTLFNPNKTVLKVFVVLYDFMDMPADSHTFLRQKIVSVKKYSDDKDEQQNLHYLVHLRFASTKHDRIYLHTDVRVIFPQQTPDTTGSNLKILTYGPVEPKYTPRDR